MSKSIMDREIALEYLARLLWIIAEDEKDLVVTGFKESRAASYTGIAPGRAAMQLTLEWRGVDACIPHVESWGDGLASNPIYRFDNAVRRAEILDNARSLMTLALAKTAPRSAEQAPLQDYEIVAQDLIAEGRVREALDLIDAERRKRSILRTPPDTPVWISVGNRVLIVQKLGKRIREFEADVIDTSRSGSSMIVRVPSIADRIERVTPIEGEVFRVSPDEIVALKMDNEWSACRARIVPRRGRAPELEDAETEPPR